MDEDRYQYWAEFKKHMDCHSRLHCLDPDPRPYRDFVHDLKQAMGDSWHGGMHFFVSAQLRRMDNHCPYPNLNVGFVFFQEGTAIPQYALLKLHEERIAKHLSQFGVEETLCWSYQQNRIKQLVLVTCKGDYRMRSEWEEQFHWFQKTLEAFHEVFIPELQRIAEILNQYTLITHPAARCGPISSDYETCQSE